MGIMREWSLCVRVGIDLSVSRLVAVRHQDRKLF